MCPCLFLDIHVLGGLIISQSGNASFVISNLKGRCDDSFQSNVYVTTWQHYSRALCQEPSPFGMYVFEYQFFCLTIFCWCPNLAGLGPTLLKVQIFEKSAKNPTLINFISNDFSIKSNLWVISPQKVQFLSNYFLIDHQSQRKSIQYQRIATWRKTVAE